MVYKFLEHTADIKIQVKEKNIEMAFISSALALKQVIAENVDIKPLLTKKIKIKGTDLSNLLYNFLEELLFLLDSEQFILSEVINFKFDKQKFIIFAEISGDKSKKYRISNDVKAITYHEMKIVERKNQVIIEFVLDV
jgi:SHS2 domain-containing protein